MQELLLAFLPFSHSLYPEACRGAYLGRAVHETKKPSSHGPCSEQREQQQQACYSPAPMAGFGLHLRAQYWLWGFWLRLGSRLAQGRG